METLLDKCKKLGLKLTEQRKIIVKVLSDSSDHPDVESVHRRAVKIDKKLVLLQYIGPLSYLKIIIYLKSTSLRDIAQGTKL